MKEQHQYPTVVCVWKSGGEYTEAHVLALHRQVQWWWPGDEALRFVVLSDRHIPSLEFKCRPLLETLPERVNGWWHKMELFAPQHQDLGDILYFDLDTMIAGPLHTLAACKRLTLLEDFYTPRHVQSGMMYLPEEVRPEVGDYWLRKKAELFKGFRGDGELLDSLWRHRAQRWQVRYPFQVISYKVHVRQQPGQEVPKDAVVVCFHGQPRPWKTKLWERLGK